MTEQRTKEELAKVADFLDEIAEDGNWEDVDGELMKPEVYREAAARLRAQDGKKDGYDVEFWHGSYHMLRESILKHLDRFIIEDDVAEEAILCEAIERAGAQDGERIERVVTNGILIERNADGEWEVWNGRTMETKGRESMLVRYLYFHPEEPESHEHG